MIYWSRLLRNIVVAILQIVIAARPEGNCSSLSQRGPPDGRVPRSRIEQLFQSALKPGEASREIGSESWETLPVWSLAILLFPRMPLSVLLPPGLLSLSIKLLVFRRHNPKPYRENFSKKQTLKMSQNGMCHPQKTFGILRVITHF